jgi:hypothetical protein
MTALYFLGKHVSFEYEPKKGELQDMIWEVDESMDGTVSYLEFSLMYRRVSSLLVRNSHALMLLLHACIRACAYEHKHHTTRHTRARTHAHTHTHALSLSLSLSLHLPTRSGRWILWDSNPESCS